MTTNQQYLKTLKRIHARASWGRHRGLLTTDEVDEEEQALLYAIRAIEREDEYMSEPTMITPKSEAMPRAKWKRVFATGRKLTNRRHPCIWGTRAQAEEGCDPDEDVVQIEYRILKTVKPRRAGDPSPF